MNKHYFLFLLSAQNFALLLLLLLLSAVVPVSLPTAGWITTAIGLARGHSVRLRAGQRPVLRSIEIRTNTTNSFLRNSSVDACRRRTTLFRMTSRRRQRRLQTRRTRTQPERRRRLLCRTRFSNRNRSTTKPYRILTLPPTTTARDLPHALSVPPTSPTKRRGRIRKVNASFRRRLASSPRPSLRPRTTSIRRR